MNLRTYLICRIIFTFVFMVISTTIWFNRRVEIYHNVESSIKSNHVIVSNLKRLNENDNTTYTIEIENEEESEKDIKVYIVPDVMETSISNNYIKYQINNGNIKTLNMDGVIMISKLEGFTKQNIDLKLWISNTYQGDLNYEGRVIVA